ncbi:unnamed protein product [Musa textilis]
MRGEEFAIAGRREATLRADFFLFLFAFSITSPWRCCPAWGEERFLLPTCQKGRRGRPFFYFYIYRTVMNGRRTLAATSFNVPFVACPCMYISLAACFAMFWCVFPVKI